MTGTKKRVGSGHKSARFAELVKQVQSINQASREGKMPAGQCAQLVSSLGECENHQLLLSFPDSIRKQLIANFHSYCTV